MGAGHPLDEKAISEDVRQDAEKEKPEPPASFFNFFTAKEADEKKTDASMKP